MTKQFAYRDQDGFIYLAHPSLLIQPGLIPGEFDTETREFTPTGNPQEQVGTIVTDAGANVHQSVLSGLREDKGADTAPLNNGIVFTQPAEIDNSVEEGETQATQATQTIESEAPLATVSPSPRRARKVK